MEGERLRAGEWAYKGEGRYNIVLSYRGDDSKARGHVLRVTKNVQEEVQEEELMLIGKLYSSYLAKATLTRHYSTEHQSGDIKNVVHPSLKHHTESGKLPAELEGLDFVLSHMLPAVSVNLRDTKKNYLHPPVSIIVRF